MITIGRLRHDYLSIELQSDIWTRDIFNATTITEVSGGICLEAHGMNILRRSVANELDDESSNEQPRKKQRTN
ncbi:unnamed protein product [Adineta steineri]|nr:unnamed protein product [Adineta steineri]